MITDRDTNFIYFSGLLKNRFPVELRKITTILDKSNIPFGYLEGTNDIWCRDYMPVQLSVDDFAGFKYEPSYLQNPIDIGLQSVPHRVCEINSIPVHLCNINLDGGNVVRGEDRVLISERVYEENTNLSKTEIVAQLEKHFQTEVIIIPHIRGDMTGHADGMVRFVNHKTILVNELKNEYKYWRIGIQKVITKHNFNYYEVPWFEPKQNKSISAIGCYINFLEVRDLIIIPQFEVESNRDEEAYTIIKKVFPDRKVERVEVNKVALEGGLLNCITWNIMHKQ